MADGVLSEGLGMQQTKALSLILKRIRFGLTNRFGSGLDLDLFLRCSYGFGFVPKVSNRLSLAT